VRPGDPAIDRPRAHPGVIVETAALVASPEHLGAIWLDEGTSGTMGKDRKSVKAILPVRKPNRPGDPAAEAQQPVTSMTERCINNKSPELPDAFQVGRAPSPDFETLGRSASLGPERPGKTCSSRQYGDSEGRWIGYDVKARKITTIAKDGPKRLRGTAEDPAPRTLPLRRG
jgi:hypothetical protein